MQQSKQELEHWYQNPDPWAYKTTEDDNFRKDKILSYVTKYGPYYRALDIGCGEGFITEWIPSCEIHGIELSDLAAERFPKQVIRVHEPDRKYDLVMTTGTMYPQYDHQKIYNWIKECSARIVIIAGIKDWLIPYDYGKLLEEEEFKYREYTQKISVYEYVG